MQTIWIVTEEYYGTHIEAVYFSMEKAKEHAKKIGLHGEYKEYDIEDSGDMNVSVVAPVETGSTVKSVAVTPDD